MNLRINRKDAVIYPDISRVFARFFFNGEDRAERLIKNILAMPESEAEVLLTQILREFSKRHRSITAIFKRHFKKVKHIVDRVNTGKVCPKSRNCSSVPILQWNMRLSRLHF